MQKVIKDLLDNSGFEIVIVSETLVPNCSMVGVCSTFGDGDCPVIREYLENPDSYELVEEEFTLESLELGFEDTECCSDCDCFDEDDGDDPCVGCEFVFQFCR